MSTALGNVAAEAVDRGSIQDPRELEDLLALLSLGGDQPERAVEVGTCFGGTLWALAQVCPVVVGVDRDISLLDSRNRGLPLVEGESAAPETVQSALAILGDAPDFIFIDAAHEPEAVWADYTAWSPTLASGGIMAFHDILGQAADAWRGLLAADPPPGEAVTQIAYSEDRGIGLVRF